MKRALEEGPIVSNARFRILLYKMHDKKIERLKEQINAIEKVDYCEIKLTFFHQFKSKGWYIGRKIFVPNNGEGVSRLIVTLPNGYCVKFHIVASLPKLASFLKDAEEYFSNTDFEKTFSFEQNESGQNYIVIDVKLPDEGL